MNFLNKILSIIFSLIFLSTPVLALELDLSVDEEIRKNYNPSKLEDEALPALPKINGTSAGTSGTNAGSQTSTTPPKSLPAGSQTTQSQSAGFQKYPVKTGEYKKKNGIKVRRGQKFTVRSQQAVSSATREGARISFALSANTPLKRSGFVIPAGTVFHGEIVETHNPQITGNGGLLVMMVDSVTYNGGTTHIDAKITKANHKKIFFDNIKGERGYIDGMVKSMKPGRTFFNTMMRWTNKLSNLGILVILTPITIVSGVVVYGVNMAGSPLFAIFSKGGKVYFPAGTEFEIKMLEEAYL